MNAQAYQDALEQRDNDVSNRQLCQLIAARKFGGTELPDVAQRYLEEFSNTDLSIQRRRWIGIALAGMIDTDVRVSSSFEMKPRELERLGEVILHPGEPEGMRIISGLIMLRLLEKGTDFASFWASDKVRNAAIEFPEIPTSRWVHDFQVFLDTLADLQLLSVATDPFILCPISVVAPDEIRWTSSNDAPMLLVIENGFMTTHVSDDSLHDLRFVDLPLEHVKEITPRPSTLHDSQGREPGHIPWDLVLKLEHDDWTYRTNMDDHSAEEICLLFKSRADVQECVKAIKEFQRMNTVQTDEVAMQIALQISPEESEQAARKRQYRTLPATEHSRQTRSSNRSKNHGRSSSLRFVRTPVVSTDSSAPTENAAGPTRTSRRTSQHAQTLDQCGQDPPNSKTVHESQSQSSKHRVRPTLREPKEDHDKSIVPRGRAGTGRDNSMSLSDTALHERDSVSRKTSLVSKEGQQMNCTGGKLAKVSQIAKQKVFQKVTHGSHLPPNDDFDLDEATDPNEEVDENSVAQSRRAKKTTQSVATGKRGRQAKIADKESEDDEYVPAAPKLTKKATGKRKSAAMSTKSVEQSRKKVKVAPENLTKSKKFTRPSEHATSAVQPRASLIGSLQDSNVAPPQPSSFKKPAMPVAQDKIPDTPHQHRKQIATHPRTPTNLSKAASISAISLSSSSSAQNASVVGTGTIRRASANSRTLSSNSKPLPASPNAESTAISGHADREDLDMEEAANNLQRGKNDPFRGPSLGRAPSALHRRLTGEGDFNEGADPAESISYSVPLDRDYLETAIQRSGSVGQPAARTARKSKSGRSPVGIGAVVDSSPIVLNRDMATTASATLTNKRSDQLLSDYEDDGDIALSSPTRRASSTKSRPAVHESQVIRPSQARHAPSSAPKSAARSPQQSIQYAPPQAVDETQSGVDEPLQVIGDLDDGTTFVDIPASEDLPVNTPCRPVHFDSSPPPFGSNRSSTSAESDHGPQTEPAMPTSEAEEMEWEASLQPHQRELHDVMIRVSKRVIRHIVDNETAVASIADEFAADSETILTNVLEKHQQEHKKLWGDMQSKKNVLKKELSGSVKKIAEERNRVASL